MRTIEHSKPSLTIFADASIYVDEMASGWGGWARGDDRDPILAGGPAKFSKDSSIVELWALALFIEQLVDGEYMSEADKSIILQSDSLHALQMLNAELPNSWASIRKHGGADIKRAATIPQEAKEPIDRIGAALKHCDVVYLRHVKGHQGGRHARSWVNEQCDRRAKKEARALFSGTGEKS